jgi:hypothetical protein
MVEPEIEVAFIACLFGSQDDQVVEIALRIFDVVGHAARAI